MSQEQILAQTRLFVDWASEARKAPLQFANQVFVQPHEKSILLTFMTYAPPIITGDYEAMKAQVDIIGTTITADCVAKIALAPDTCRGLIKILQDKLEQESNEAVQGGTKE